MDTSDFYRKVLSVFPNATIDVDNDGQLVVYTNYQFLTSLDNPSIPEGECIIQEFTN